MSDAMREATGPRPHTTSSEDGFTLLEIMVALAILGGVIVTALVSVSHHLTVMDENLDIAFASMLARSKLVEMGLGNETRKERGGFGEPYEDFTWKYERESGDYQGTWNETVTVSRAGSGPSVTLMTTRVEVEE